MSFRLLEQKGFRMLKPTTVDELLHVPTEADIQTERLNELLREADELIKKLKEQEPKQGEPGKDGGPDTGKEIVDKVNSLPLDDEFKISANHIKDFPMLGGGGRRKATLWIEELLSPSGNNSTFVLKRTPLNAAHLHLKRGGAVLSTLASDFTLVGKTITLTTELDVANGEILIASYLPL